MPVERLFDVYVAPLAGLHKGEVVATLLTLRDQTEARQVERLPRRLHRQRQSRAAHAARLAGDRLHRDLARLGT